MIKTKKITTVLMMAIMFVMVFSMVAPTTALANNIWDEFEVRIDSEEGLVVNPHTTNDSAWETLLEKYQGFITGIAAVGAVTMVVLFIIQFLKLGASAGNPSARSQAMVGVLWTGLAAAGLGAVALITRIFYSAV